ncbi:MAG TPA: xanthine dehydrogenase family protein molybdopterin-binding subunit [Microvirga sp.]|jgi:isoquinoline 1-oxidoreductase beta subunit
MLKLNPLKQTTASRRAFLTGSAAAAGALVIGTTLLFPRVKANAATAGGVDSGPPQPNAFVKIAPDNTVTVMIKHLDMGQGNTTGLATIVADELDADWAQMRAAFAPADAKLYNNLLMGPVQGTGGSTAIANSWTQLRKAGAAAREMLVAAAASEWKVPASEIRVQKGVVSHPVSGRSATFGQLAASAAKLPVPQEPRLKDPKDWVYIGKRVPRIDSATKTDGSAVYSLDIRRPNGLTAVVAHAPQFGAVVKSFDASAAKQVPGVTDVVQIPTGVAVVAKDTWSAMRGRDALRVTWDDSLAEKRSTETLMAEYKTIAPKPGHVAASRGDAAGALSTAAKVLEGEFELPYLAHAAMEPMNSTVAQNPDGTVDVWSGSQFPTIDQAVVASIMGVTADKVRINTVWAGGSFGRRVTPQADYLAEAATILKAIGGRAPVHLVWTREDDMRAGYYRPMVYHRVRAGLDARGNVTGWQSSIVTKSVLLGTPFEAAVLNGVDTSSVEGASDTAYAIPNFHAEVHNAKEGTPVLWWRSVGHSHTAQVMEVFIDELAHAAGQDPLQYRLALLKDAPRHAAVLRLAAEKAGWGQALPKGRGRGVAVHRSFGSHVAMVADVTVASGALKVDRIVAAVDCGIPVNPDVIAAQIEGSVGFALSSVLRNRITLQDGVVQEANFDAYEPTRMSEMPKVEVHIVPSAEAPSGIGEPGVPTVGPAIANAVFAATGKRLRSLPLDLAALRGV